MAERPAYDKLERRIKNLELEAKKHKRISEKLRQTEATARALLNASTDSAILIAADGTILAANEMAVYIFHKSGENIVKMNIYDILSSNVAKHKKVKIDSVILLGEPINFEDEIDGHLFHNSVYPIFDRHGSVEKVAMYCRDITD
jgi:PAS domain S-box-containing protein